MALETATHTELDEIVNRLVDALSPEAIYLFGSYAKGEANRDSDVDLLVVVGDDAGDTHALNTEGRKALPRIGIPVDLVVLNRSEMDKWGPVPTFLPREVLETGELVYAVAEEPSEHQRIRQRSVNSNGGATCSQGAFMTSEPHSELAVREWMRFVARDLYSAQLNLQADPPVPEYVCFHAQQAMEKALKGWLTHHAIKFPWTHDLVILLDLCVAQDQTFETFREYAKELTEHAVRIRYPLQGQVPDASLARSALDAAREVNRFVLERLPKTVHPS